MSLVEGIPQTIKEIGSARAGKAAARGNYGPTLARIGQGIADLPNELQQNRAADQREQLGNLQLADAQRKQAASQALDQAMTSALKPDGTFDSSLLAQHLAGTPAAGQYPEIQEHLNAWQESELRLKKANEDAKGAEADAMGRLAKGASAAGDPHDQAGVLLAGLASRVKQGLMRQEDATDVISNFMGDDNQPDPEKVKATIERMLQESGEQRELGVKESHAKYETENAASLAEDRQSSIVKRQADAATATQKANEETAAKTLTNTAKMLASATTKDRYAQIYRGVPENLKDYFHAPDEWDKDLSPKVARLAAMTPAEQTSALDRMTDNERADISRRETERHNRAMEARPVDGAQGGPVSVPGKVTIPDVAPGARNEDYLKTLSDSDAALVKGLAEGRKAFPTGSALRSEYWQGILGAVAKYDPMFDEVNYNARAATRKDFTSGKSAQQINALNTVIGHIAQLSDAAAALKNSDFKSYNKIANALQSEFGWTGKTDFDTIAPKVAQELTRVWRGTGGSEADIQRDIDALASSNAPGQLHSSIANLGGLVESKLDALKETYRQGMGTADIEMITPEARKALTTLEQRSGRPAATDKPADSQGATPGLLSYQDYLKAKGQKP